MKILQRRLQVLLYKKEKKEVSQQTGKLPFFLNVEFQRPQIQTIHDPVPESKHQCLGE